MCVSVVPAPSPFPHESSRSTALSSRRDSSATPCTPKEASMQLDRNRENGPLTESIKFLALLGLITIFGLGVMLGYMLAYSLLETGSSSWCVRVAHPGAATNGDCRQLRVEQPSGRDLHMKGGRRMARRPPAIPRNSVEWV